MRDALTMIELIFVIIILGVLSTVAIPKLQATRDDAKIATVAQQIQIGLSEILETYTATGLIKKPYQMSQVLNELVHVGRAAETSVNQIAGSVGQLTLYTKDGNGGEDHPFVYDINQTTLVIKYGAPCVGFICTALQQRIVENNYSVGGDQIVF
jgi:prepilin-type N-terminal cleavage/methylation domain-containing protein